MRTIKTLLRASGASLCLAFSLLSNATTVVTVDMGNPGPVINKNVYGQFAEHLGRLMYDGLWVGPESNIPNYKGWRSDAVTALQALKVPVVRWPGGCFADEYQWRNGIGPRDQRPATVNTLWGGVEDSNAVGTHEYFDLIELLGAEAYISGNLGSGSAREMSEWMEYMTTESQSALGQLRRANGREKPFRVQHFGIGNESWGCGGHMSPPYYTNLYKQWVTMLRPPWGVPTKFVASGGHGYGDAIDPSGPTEWTDYLTANITPNFLLGFDAVSFHYYTHPKGSVMEAKGPAIQFPEAEWMSTLAATLKMDAFIAANKVVMNKNDPNNTVALYVDEWGSWYDVAPSTNPAFLYQQNSMRDAVVAALNFNIFHKHADRVQMTNIAQMVNVLQAMILTEKEKMLLTPTYHAYKMYVPFQQATSLPVSINDASLYTHGDNSIPAVSVSAARGIDGKIYLALVNTNPNSSESVALRLSGSVVKGVSGQILTSATMDAHNTFETPNTVVPQAYVAKAKNAELQLDLPAKSVIVVAVE
ncbi:MAG: alpha-N-arabinofuranosidase [Pseudomonadales bacterium]